MQNATIDLCGEAVTPDPLGGLYWPREETLIVSDLHFEKGSSFADRGVLLPPYDTRTTLMRLEALMRRYGPKRIVSLGDAFHDAGAEARMDAEDGKRLAKLLSDADWVWILGNHDPEPPARFAARAETEWRFDPFLLRHEPAQRPAPGEIAGHLHPCARVAAEGRVLRRRCFAVGSDRLIMPALGAYTGGLNILDEAFGALGPLSAWVLGAKGVYGVAADCLAPDPSAPARLSARRG